MPRRAGMWGLPGFGAARHAPRLVPGLSVVAGQLVGGRYRVEERLGSGPSGVVLSGRHADLRRPVTLKILASYTDTDVLARRVRRARLASQLVSRHVARIFEIGETVDGLPFVATERLDGVTLEAELAAQGRFAVDWAVDCVLQACIGLAEAHAAGLVHGDLKPSNLFLAEGGPGQPPTLKILDFGMTSPLDALDDASGTAFFASPAYLAPEQIRGERFDARADVWALGVCLHQLVSGALPFVADSLSGVLVAVVQNEPPMLTDAPYELARIVQRCLAKSPDDRPSDVGELATLLAPFAPRGDALAREARATLDAMPALVLAEDELVDEPEPPPLPLLRTKRSRAAPARRGRLVAAAITVASVAAIVTAIDVGLTDTPKLVVEDEPPSIPSRDMAPVAPFVPVEPAVTVAMLPTVTAMVAPPRRAPAVWRTVHARPATRLPVAFSPPPPPRGILSMRDDLFRTPK